MKRQCIEENITSALNDLVYLFCQPSIYIFVYNVFLLICLYALLCNIQLILFYFYIWVIIFKNMLSCTYHVVFKQDLALYKFILINLFIYLLS